MSLFVCIVRYWSVSWIEFYMNWKQNNKIYFKAEAKLKTSGNIYLNYVLHIKWKILDGNNINIEVLF